MLLGGWAALTMGRPVLPMALGCAAVVAAPNNIEAKGPQMTDQAILCRAAADAAFMLAAIPPVTKYMTTNINYHIHKFPTPALYLFLSLATPTHNTYPATRSGGIQLHKIDSLKPRAAINYLLARPPYYELPWVRGRGEFWNLRDLFGTIRANVGFNCRAPG
jgi:hypothetical protein